MQDSLFDSAELTPPIEGLAYQPDFLSAEEEAALIALVQTFPLHAARYKQYLARRRVASFGGSYDYEANRLLPGKPMDERLLPLRERVAQWLGIAPERLANALASEYVPGTPLGWHRDVPDFELVAGVSLGSAATIHFRPHPPDAAAKRRVLALNVAPRSIYKFSGPARWAWQHCVPPVPALRWSITFRTRRQP